jgi:hypothetical protein
VKMVLNRHRAGRPMLSFGLVYKGLGNIIPSFVTSQRCDTMCSTTMELRCWIGVEMIETTDNHIIIH